MTPDVLDIELAKARRRGVAAVEALLRGPEMLTEEAFASLIGADRDALRDMAAERRVLALEDGRGHARYPDWQAIGDGALSEAMPGLFTLLDDSPWAVYRFLVQPHPAFGGTPPLRALRSGAIAEVIEAAEGVARGDFG